MDARPAGVRAREGGKPEASRNYSRFSEATSEENVCCVRYCRVDLCRTGRPRTRIRVFAKRIRRKGRLDDLARRRSDLEPAAVRSEIFVSSEEHGAGQMTS